MPLAEGDGGKNIRSQMSVGTLVLHAGLWSSLDDYGKFIRIVDKDQYRASEAIQMAFIQACEKAGIPFQESIRPVGCPSRRRSTATPSSASLKGHLDAIPRPSSGRAAQNQAVSGRLGLAERSSDIWLVRFLAGHIVPRRAEPVDLPLMPRLGRSEAVDPRD